MDADRDEVFEPYLTSLEGTKCYVAGLPSYPRNFSRDVFIAGILAQDTTLLHSQLVFSTQRQGEMSDPITGEELGKIHHEYPGVVWREPYLTTYNACDTTALYLISLEALLYRDGAIATDFVEAHVTNIDNAVRYLEKHIVDDIFWEYPPKNAMQYSVRCTYWKDSVIPDSFGGEEPTYPVSYALVQFQVARALLSASRFLRHKELASKADALFRAGIATFLRDEAFCLLWDQSRRLEQTSSDEIHCLAYIPVAYAPLLPLEAIVARAHLLMTPVGLACTPQAISEQLTDNYHGYVVWIFEQALLHYACQKFGLSGLADITKKCIKYIGEGQELLTVVPGVRGAGNERQLWSVAARVYFSGRPSLRQTTWL